MNIPASGKTPLRIVHLLNEYLPYSQTWIYPQVTLPEVESTVIARVRIEANLKVFPHPRVVTIRERHPLRYRLALAADPFRLRAVSTLAHDLIREANPDLVHGHFGHFSWRFLEAARRSGRPYLASFYGRDMSMMPRQAHWRERYLELFRDATAILCLGDFMAAEIVKLGCPRSKLIMLPIGADLSLCRFSERVKRPEEPLRVLVAARFTEKKGIPDAIRAAGLAAREAPLTLSIIGAAAADAEGKREQARIAQAVLDSGLGESVRFLGSMPLPRLMEEAAGHHVFLAPSKHAEDGDHEGGYPVICIEVGATGMPTVATRHADMDMVVKDGATGLLADEGDVETLARHLVRMAREPGLPAEMGRAAHALATRSFDVHAYQTELHRVYLRLAGRTSA